MGVDTSDKDTGDFNLHLVRQIITGVKFMFLKETKKYFFWKIKRTKQTAIPLLYNLHFKETK